jgi:glucose-1-phosphate thymidylyltransferase
MEDIVIIEDILHKNFLPASRVRGVFDLRFGIYTPYEKIKRIFKDTKIHIRAHKSIAILYKNTDNLPKSYIPIVPDPYILTKPRKEIIAISSSPTIYEKDYPIIPKLVHNLEKIIIDDVKLWYEENKEEIIHSGKFEIVGEKEELFIHKEAYIYPGTIFDTTSGPIVIDKGCKVKPLSYIAGPVYIGKECIIESARIRGPVSIGNVCRIGGEIERSIIQDYTNKHHDGFLGHSYLGSWVNLGACTTTSDLKNTYGNISIWHNGKNIALNTNKFGSIISDYAKTSIGYMLNTGSVIDIAANLFKRNIEYKYYPPFMWGDKENIYKIDDFLIHLQRMKKRRGKEISEGEEKLLRKIYLTIQEKGEISEK